MVAFRRGPYAGMSKELKEFMLGTLEMDESPFLREGDKTYLRYDAIRVEMLEHATVLVFLFHEVEIWRYWFPPTKDGTLTIASLDGKLEFQLT